LTTTSKVNVEIECPICGCKVTQNRLRINEANIRFLHDYSKDGTLDECITILRLIVERIPGIQIDVSNKSALEEYFKKIQDQVAHTVITPIALLVDNANRLIERLSGLAENVPSDIKSEFMEINRDFTEKLESMKKIAAETPLTMFNETLNPLVEKIGQLIEKLPKNLREEFKEVKIELQEKLAEIKNNAHESSVAVGCEVKELRNTINTLINKPTARGRFGESVLSESWIAEFAQDIVDPKGGAGEPDALVVPYLGMNGGDYGQKISVERKAGTQKYSGKHLEEASRHAKKCGATQVMLIYDDMTNLPEDLRPLKIIFRPQQRLTIAVACLEERTWVTAREMLEVLQIADPPDGESKHEINLAELDKAVSDIHVINATIDKLRKTNNTVIRCCEGTRTHIEELELLILSYQNRLKHALDGREQQTRLQQR
jgi:hypothetical protein